MHKMRGYMSLLVFLDISPTDRQVHSFLLSPVSHFPRLLRLVSPGREYLSDCHSRWCRCSRYSCWCRVTRCGYTLCVCVCVCVIDSHISTQWDWIWHEACVTSQFSLIQLTQISTSDAALSMIDQSIRLKLHCTMIIQSSNSHDSLLLFIFNEGEREKEKNQWAKRKRSLYPFHSSEWRHLIYSGASERLVLPLKRTSKRKTRPAVLSQTRINILIIRLIIALSLFPSLSLSLLLPLHMVHFDSPVVCLQFTFISPAVVL